MNETTDSRSFLSIVSFGMSIIALAVFVLPQTALAYSALHWTPFTENPDTGERTYAAALVIEQGGSYEVPQGAIGEIFIETDTLVFDTEGVLYFVPNPEISTREFISNLGGVFGEFEFAWPQEGVYELDIYESEAPVPVWNPAQKFLAWLFGTPAYAQNPELFIETIRFTIIEKSSQPLPECCSSVLFLPGLKGSILKTATETLWPSDASSTDFPELALNEDGTSVNEIFVDGILPSFKIHIPFLGDVGPEIYSGFSSFMNTLVESEDDGVPIAEWKPFPYDWRYSPEYIVAHDVETPSGPVGLLSIAKSLAYASPTGKITIVAHSMGGLVGKALIKALEDESAGGSDIVDAFVMIASPQLGTPQAVASLLHGDAEGIPGRTLVPNFFVMPAVARAAGRNFPSAYSLLPSARYFEEIEDPVIVFDDVSFTKDWRDFWGDAISAYAPFVEFLTGTGVVRERPNPNLPYLPEVLREDLLAVAGDFHGTFDTFEFPSHIRVIEIAGWGEETAKAVVYETQHFLQNYDTDETVEGDGVVVYPSAIGSTGAEKYFFNLDLDDTGLEHGTLLNASQVQDLVKSVIGNSTIEETGFISVAKPDTINVSEKLLVSTHSPVILGAYDDQNRYTGIYPGQDLSAPFLYAQQHIPGSSFVVSGENQHLFLPNEGLYNVVYQGIGSGPTTVEIEEFSNDAVSLIESYTDIPTTSQTLATLALDSASPAGAPIEVDENGDDIPELVVFPDAPIKTFEELLADLRVLIQNLDASDKLKSGLVRRIDKLEKKVEKQKVQKSAILGNLEKQVIKREAKGAIDSVSASELIALIGELDAQAAIFPLDPTLVAELQSKVESLVVPNGLKNSLQKKIERLLKLTLISKTLSRFISTVERNGSKGRITGDDVHTLINVLTQLENAL